MANDSGWDDLDIGWDAGDAVAPGDLDEDLAWPDEADEAELSIAAPGTTPAEAVPSKQGAGTPQVSAHATSALQSEPAPSTSLQSFSDKAALPGLAPADSITSPASGGVEDVKANSMHHTRSTSSSAVLNGRPPLSPSQHTRQASNPAVPSGLGQSACTSATATSMSRLGIRTTGLAGTDNAGSNSSSTGASASVGATAGGGLLQAVPSVSSMSHAPSVGPGAGSEASFGFSLVDGASGGGGGAQGSFAGLWGNSSFTGPGEGDFDDALADLMAEGGGAPGDQAAAAAAAPPAGLPGTAEALSSESVGLRKAELPAFNSAGVSAPFGSIAPPDVPAAGGGDDFFDGLKADDDDDGGSAPPAPPPPPTQQSPSPLPQHAAGGNDVTYVASISTPVLQQQQQQILNGQLSSTTQGVQHAQDLPLAGHYRQEESQLQLGGASHLQQQQSEEQPPTAVQEGGSLAALFGGGDEDDFSLFGTQPPTQPTTVAQVGHTGYSLAAGITGTAAAAGPDVQPGGYRYSAAAYQAAFPASADGHDQGWLQHQQEPAHQQQQQQWAQPSQPQPYVPAAAQQQQQQQQQQQPQFLQPYSDYYSQYYQQQQQQQPPHVELPAHQPQQPAETYPGYTTQGQQQHHNHSQQPYTSSQHHLPHQGEHALLNAGHTVAAGQGVVSGQGPAAGGDNTFFDHLDLDLGREPSLAVTPPPPAAPYAVDANTTSQPPAPTHQAGGVSSAQPTAGALHHPAPGAHSWQGWQPQEQAQVQQQANAWAGTNPHHNQQPAQPAAHQYPQQQQQWPPIATASTPTGSQWGPSGGAQAPPAQTWGFGNTSTTTPPPATPSASLSVVGSGTSAPPAAPTSGTAGGAAPVPAVGVDAADFFASLGGGAEEEGEPPAAAQPLPEPGSGSGVATPSPAGPPNQESLQLQDASSCQDGSHMQQATDAGSSAAAAPRVSADGQVAALLPTAGQEAGGPHSARVSQSGAPFSHAGGAEGMTGAAAEQGPASNVKDAVQGAAVAAGSEPGTVVPQQEQQGTGEAGAAGSTTATTAAGAETSSSDTASLAHQWAEYYAQQAVATYGMEHYTYYYNHFYQQYMEQAQAAQGQGQGQKEQQQQDQASWQVTQRGQDQAAGDAQGAVQQQQQHHQQQPQPRASGAGSSAVSGRASLDSTQQQQWQGYGAAFAQQSYHQQQQQQQQQQQETQQAGQPNAWQGYGSTAPDAGQQHQQQQAFTPEQASWQQAPCHYTAGSTSPYGGQQQQQSWSAYGATAITTTTAAANSHQQAGHPGAQGYSAPHTPQYAPGQQPWMMQGVGGAGGGSNLYSQAYDAAHRVIKPGTLVELPVTMEAARSCPSGRPAAPFVRFGFGGRAVVVHVPSRPAEGAGGAGSDPQAQQQQQQSWGMSGAGIAQPTQVSHVTVAGTLTSLPAALAAVNVSATSSAEQATPGAAAGGGGGLLSPRLSVARKTTGKSASGSDPSLAPLLSWPGPLTPGHSRDKLAAYAAGRAAGYACEDPHAGQGPEEVGRLMWQVLGVMVQHGGLVLMRGGAGGGMGAAPGGSAGTGGVVGRLGLLGLGGKEDGGQAGELELIRILSKPTTDGSTTPTGVGGGASVFSLAAAAWGKGGGGGGGGAAAGGRGVGGTSMNGTPLDPPLPSGMTTPPLAAGGGGGPGLSNSELPAPLVPRVVDEGRQQAAAEEVQRLVVAGRRVDAVKVAREASLWGLALLLATSCPGGGPVFQETAAAMAAEGLLPGTPLATLSLMLAGRPDMAVGGARAALTAGAGVSGGAGGGGQGVAGRLAAVAAALGGGGASGGTAGVGGAAWGQAGSGHGQPHLAPGLTDGQGMLLSAWRQNLAVMASAARGPPDLEAICVLGDALRTQAAAVGEAHLCYLIAGLVPALYDPAAGGGGEGPGPGSTGATATAGNSPLAGSQAAAHAASSAPGTTQGPGGPGAAGPASGGGGGRSYCLLGVDHGSAPRTYAHVLAIQRTEMYEWARMMAAQAAAGGSAPGGGAGGGGGAGPGSDPLGGLLPPLLPYKLVHAHLLAEAGRVAEALAYCQALDVGLKAVGAAGRLPSSLLSALGRELEELRDRVTTFAAAHSITVSRSESSITKIGRFLDGTLNKLLWGSSEPAGSGASGAAAGAGAGSTGAAGGPGAAGGLASGAGPAICYGGPNAPVVSLQLPATAATGGGPVKAGGVTPASSALMSRVASTAQMSPSGPPSQNAPSIAEYMMGGPGGMMGGAGGGGHHMRVPSQGSDLGAAGLTLGHSGGSHSRQPSYSGPTGAYASQGSHRWGAGGLEMPGGSGALPGAEGSGVLQPPSHTRNRSDGMPAMMPGYGDGSAGPSPGFSPGRSGQLGRVDSQQGFSSLQQQTSLMSNATSMGLPPLPPSSQRSGPLSSGAPLMTPQQQGGGSDALSNGTGGAPPAPKSQGKGGGGWGLLGLFGGRGGGGNSAADGSKQEGPASNQQQQPPPPQSKGPTAAAGGGPPPGGHPSTGRSGPSSTGGGGSGPKKASLGEESQFYYDKERKRWVLPGAEEPEPPPAPAAPPTSFAFAASLPPAHSAQASSQGPPSTGGGGVDGSASMPPAMSMSFSRGSGVRSRYVDVLGGNRQASAQPQPAPSSSSSQPLDPTTSGLLPPGVGAGRPPAPLPGAPSGPPSTGGSRPAFFMPAAPAAGGQAGPDPSASTQAETAAPGAAQTSLETPPQPLPPALLHPPAAGGPAASQGGASSAHGSHGSIGAPYGHHFNPAGGVPQPQHQPHTPPSIGQAPGRSAAGSTGASSNGSAAGSLPFAAGQSFSQWAHSQDQAQGAFSSAAVAGFAGTPTPAAAAAAAAAAPTAAGSTPGGAASTPGPQYPADYGYGHAVASAATSTNSNPVAAEDWMSSYNPTQQYGSQTLQEQQQQQQQHYYGMGAANANQHNMSNLGSATPAAAWPGAAVSMGGDLQEVEL